jgi:hypothetical protein
VIFHQAVPFSDIIIQNPEIVHIDHGRFDTNQVRLQRHKFHSQLHNENKIKGSSITGLALTRIFTTPLNDHSIRLNPKPLFHPI